MGQVEQNSGAGHDRLVKELLLAGVLVFAGADRFLEKAPSPAQGQSGYTDSP
ncbi:MAG: hypothetical protein LBH43_09150 [Treponema sp.]|nr:hypothetical protein [Treponema sp.]